MSTAATTQSIQKNVLDMNDESVFSKNLQSAIRRIYAASDADEIMLEVSKDICTLFSADQLTIYAHSEDRAFLTSRVTAGFDS